MLDYDEWTVFVEKNAGWFMFLEHTPKLYADAVAKFMNEEPDYGSCLWGG
jgi:hypothetical protein